MTILNVLQKTWDRDILFSALVELTYRCNLDCFFCYNDLGLQGRPLDDEAYFRLFDDLAEMQVMNLTFTGGEPLAHPSFLALGRRAHELGFVVRIKSNGHALRGQLARDIRQQVDPFLIEISLHGATADVHDRQTRVPGSFERLMGNLDELRDLGQRVKLNGTLTRWNEHQVEEMFALADARGLLFSLSPTVTPRDDGDLGPLAVAPSAEGVRNLYAYLDRRLPDPPESATEVSCHGDPGPDSQGRKKNCGAGSSGIAIDPYGQVYPCIQWRRALGSLHEQSIREIWTGSSELGEIRRLNGAARSQVAAMGEAGVGLSHCMGLSEEKTGDPLALDPQASDQARLLREARLANRQASVARDRPLLPVVE